VADALVDIGEPPVIEALLRNELVRLSHQTVENIVADDAGRPRLIPLLLRRAELRPSHAYVMFWWADAEARKTDPPALRRVARDPAGRRRRRLRPGLGRGLAGPAVAQGPAVHRTPPAKPRGHRQEPFDSLDEAVAAAQNGMTREIAEEISYLSGLKPMTGAKIFTDPSAASRWRSLCKATGLPRAASGPCGAGCAGPGGRSHAAWSTGAGTGADRST
jgi:uncharacterized protein (DUF2336 family)